jgi:hypothetical protein
VYATHIDASIERSRSTRTNRKHELDDELRRYRQSVFQKNSRDKPKLNDNPRICCLAVIRTPTGKLHTPTIGDNQDGTVSIKYQPSEVGLHELDVFYQGQPIAGSPFKFHVDQVQTGCVTAYGPGLSHGLCNEAANFRIITKDAGSGGLSVAVEGASKAEIQCKDNKDGTCDVTYWPVS